MRNPFRKRRKSFVIWFVALLFLSVFLAGCSADLMKSTMDPDIDGVVTIDLEEDSAPPGQEQSDEKISENGTYTSKEDVALYLHTYGKLPSNYITKKEAQALGWDSKKGNLWDVAEGKSIGGDRFGNYEGALPDNEGRKYQECDIDYEGGRRNAKRIVFSNDGLIYYTEDHYKTFELLY